MAKERADIEELVDEKTRRWTPLDALASMEDHSLERLASTVEINRTIEPDDAPTGTFQWGLFSEMLKAEICRADRGLSLVSVVLIEGKDASLIRSHLSDLRVILRSYDELCCIEDCLLGLIMPGVAEKNLLRVTFRLAQILAGNAVRFGYAAWTPGEDSERLLRRARARLQRIEQRAEPTRQTHQPSVLLWLDGFPFALPVQANPRTDGIELCLDLPSKSSKAQVRARGGAGVVACRISRVSLSDETLRFRVKTVMPRQPRHQPGTLKR